MHGGQSRHYPHLDRGLGPLESLVLDVLWSRATAACVRDLQPEFPAAAYTTLMTTLERLFRKGVLHREKHGRAFFYHPRFSRDQWRCERAGSTFATLLPGDRSAMRPILSLFVDAVGARDHTLLDELESLVRARRDELAAKAAK